MSVGNRDLLITHDQFASALADASAMSDEALKKVSGGSIARSYFVRHDGRLMSLKAVTRLAYVRSGQVWNDLQSELVARRLRSAFDILHITATTERERLERQREIAERWARPKQAKFREKLLELYQGQCAISGCTVLEAIDAAHVVGVDGAGEDVNSNGLILRADLHRIFDRHLLAIDPKSGAVRFHSSCMSNYAAFEGQVIQLPAGGPALKQFSTRWQGFSKIDQQ